MESKCIDANLFANASSLTVIVSVTAKLKNFLIFIRAKVTPESGIFWILERNEFKRSKMDSDDSYSWPQLVIEA